MENRVKKKTDEEGLTARAPESGVRTMNPVQSQPPGMAALLFQLQQTRGNRFTQQLLRSSLIQAKLAVSQPGDEYEREADDIADQVMRMPKGKIEAGGRDADITPLPRIRRLCTACGEEEGLRRPQGEAEGRLRRKADDQAGGEVDSSVESAIESVRGNGQPLSQAARDFFEPRFGYDFGRVRIHADSRGDGLARSLQARAFTVGSDVVFRAGEYSPDTNEGRKLLAHELTHVAQQTGAGIRRKHTVTPPVRQAEQAIVQRFESDEHQQLGNVATSSATYDLGSPGDKFELTHGDIVALSGDVFMPDDLFRLAKIPGNRGQAVGTRDEILWGLQDTRIWEMRAMTTGPFVGKKDPRFETGGPYAGYVYSDQVKDAVFERYRKLGAANVGHFAAPQGRDAKGNPLPAADSAVSNYRKFHEVAIREAEKAGRAKLTIDLAMAREAAAQHFLTDEFSAGHVRTPIALIRDYWGKKYPLFWYNLRHKIALDTAIELTSGTPIPTYDGYKEILASVEAMAPKLPAVTLGDLLASVFHDVDNEQGVNVEGGGKVLGDKHLDTDTQKLAVAAIQAGNKDVQKAYEIGKQMPNPVPDADLFYQVRSISGGKGDKYAPELQTPTPAKTEPPQNWKAADINALWDQKLLGTTGDTVGQVISKRVQGGAIAVQLTALAENFPVDSPVIVKGVKLGNVHPRAAYLAGFVRRLQADAKAGLLDIINWAPHGMSTGYAPREAVADLEAKGAAGDKRENLGNMTMEQRVLFIRRLISDGKDDDLEAIIKIFANMPVAERPNLYKAIEGHDWTGDFQRSFGGRDDLFKAMKDNTRVDRLKDVINGK